MAIVADRTLIRSTIFRSGCVPGVGRDSGPVATRNAASAIQNAAANVMDQVMYAMPAIVAGASRKSVEAMRLAS